MTLVTAINFCPGIAIMTTDSRHVIIREYWDEDLKRHVQDPSNYFEVLDEEAQKTVFLSDYVMVGVGGVSSSCLFILKQMAKIVKKNDDLMTCQKKLDALIQKARKKKKETPHYSAYFDIEERFMVCLNGFCKDGTAGMVNFLSGPDSHSEFLRTDFLETRWSMVAPEKRYYEWGNELVDDETGGTGLLSNAITLHAKISAIDPLRVSSDCHYRIIQFDVTTGKTEKKKGVFDTAEWHDRFKNGAV